MKISFHGATDTVTGSRFLFERAGRRWLVDCGLFQGGTALAERNHEPLPFDPATLDAVLLTHAHIDHSGFLPGLFRAGFKGPIYATQGTIELCSILLPDSARLQEEHYRYLERKGLATPADSPLYTGEDADAALAAMRPCEFHRPFELLPGVSARYRRAGHILGAASVYLVTEGITVCVSGDIGRPADPVMRAPEGFAGANYLLVESTYGGRLHESTEPAIELETVLQETIEQKGTTVIPAFAVGRAQTLLHLIADAFEAGRLTKAPVFLDSPMAINASRMYCGHSSDHRLSDAQCEAACSIARYTRSVEESRAIAKVKGPKIVIAASGMATGGRVLHHLKRYLPDTRNTVIVAGYQAAGTLGAELLEGPERVKVFGRDVPVRARIETVTGLSAHADQAELTFWLQHAALAPSEVFMVHGEESSRAEFAAHVRQELGWKARAPSPGATIELD